MIPWEFPPVINEELVWIILHHVIIMFTLFQELWSVYMTSRALCIQITYTYWAWMLYGVGVHVLYILHFCSCLEQHMTFPFIKEIKFILCLFTKKYKWSKICMNNKGLINGSNASVFGCGVKVCGGGVYDCLQVQYSLLASLFADQNFIMTGIYCMCLKP